ncbi:hypothetical protein CWO92_01865 [Heyndrickxia camelliae]|uniref:TNase-like domain-containing protein n=2 Tax=Heyndrickxia camelliae TaxID=1707093 RepID=A0A2N3LR45_9BACI|nr:hypothetical protein CWO92_01865 [Heyndrickxia camelliae]
MNFIRKFGFLLLFIFVLLGACSQSSVHQNKKQSDTPQGLVAGTIIRTVDGDTVHVNINGKEENIRLLLIDTPETHKPGTPVQPYGPEASDYAKKELAVGTKVMVEEGVKGHERDKYGRLLAYIYLPNGKMYNEEVVKKGLARVAYIYEPNTMHLSDLKKDESYAKKHKLGIWSITGYVTEKGYDISKATLKSSGTESNKNSSDTATKYNTGCKGQIKGNVNSKIYHVPGGENYDSKMNHIVWFCSEVEAQKAGYRKAKR